MRTLLSTKWPRLPQPSQRAFMGGLLFLFVAVSVQYSLKVMQPREDGMTRSAILRWSPQIQALEEGVDISRAFNYPNPPIMALMLWPFTELPPLAAALTWFYVKVAMALLAMFWTFRMLETPERPFPPWAKALAVVLSLRPILSDLSHGNVNILILFLVVGALYAFHTRRDFLSGLVLALAIACKLTPALLICYFVWKRSWSALAGTALGLWLFFFGVPGAILGFEYNWQLLTGWVEVMVMPFIQGGFVTSEHHNQSLPGLVYRLLTHNPSFSDYIKDVYTPLAYSNFMNLSTATAQWVVKVCMGLFAVLIMWTCRHPAKGVRRGWPLPAEYSLLLIGMLLFSERTWKHHAVTLLVPYAVLCYALAAGTLSRLGRRAVIASLVISTLLIASTSKGLLGSEAADAAQVYGGFTFAFLVLAAGCAVVLRQARSCAARPSSLVSQ